MRLLQLATGPGELLDLHPNVTVVVGLDGTSHDVLVDAVAGLARASAPSEGLLEAHGVLFDLDAELLGVLGFSEDGLDPIVHPSELPTQPISVDARELRAREQDFARLLEQIAAQAERQSLARGSVAAAAQAVEDARRARADNEAGAARRLDEVDRLTRRLDQLVERRRQVEEELAALRPSLAAARQERVEAEERTADVRAAKDRAVERRTALEAELAAVELEVDPSTADDVARAEAELERVEDEIAAERAREADAATAALEAAAPQESDPHEEPVAVRLDRLEARARELEHLLSVVTPVERDGIEEALAMLQGGDAAELVPSTEAAALADELDRISLELGDPGAERAGGAGRASLVDARARLDDARQALLEAEQAVRNPELDRDDVMQLEDVHGALLDATDKAEGRFGRERARNRVKELRAAEQEVLDRLGFTSYSDYMMGYSLLHIDPEKEAQLDAARAELAAAEDEWRRLEADTDAALARAAILDRRRALLEEARALLGRAAPGGRPQEALRALRVPAVSLRESAHRLHAALDAAGVDLGGEDLDHEELALIAEAWLDEADDVARRRHAMVEERTALEAECAPLRVEVDGAGGAGPADAVALLDAEQARVERLTRARAALDAARHRDAARTAAAARRATLADDVQIARDLERAANDAASTAEAEIRDLLATETPLAGRVDALDEELAAATSESAEVDEALRGLSGAAPDPATLDAAIAAAEQGHREALEAVEREDRALAALDAEGRAAALEIERLQDIVAAQGSGTATPAEELEWYLLARLAAQRSVSVAGSLPLLLDDALRGLDGGDVGRLLDRLERMAEAVQVIIVSDDPVVASWAEEAGPARAAVVSPGAP